ncbi:MAG: hypothetical protein MPJ24_06760 [Pirellulaceae bacterium]|nr:hypothetical protein [Pirellulaceae bacterium]
MQKLIDLVTNLVTLVAVATVIVQIVLFGLAYSYYGIDRAKYYDLLAVLTNVDEEELRQKLENEKKPKESEQVSLAAIRDARINKSLDLDLRETALDKEMLGLWNLRKELLTERSRYDQLKKSFDARLLELEQIAKNDGIRELQNTLASMKPRQAKDHILLILNDGAIDAIVTIMKSMPMDKRKKIIAEFRTPEEAKELEKILKSIRLGMPQIGLIEQTRSDMKLFSPLKG